MVLKVAIKALHTSSHCPGPIPRGDYETALLKSERALLNGICHKLMCHQAAGGSKVNCPCHFSLCKKHSERRAYKLIADGLGESCGN